MTGIGPNKRPTALIFQNLALFPLMTVAETSPMVFACAAIDKTTRRKKADELSRPHRLKGPGRQAGERTLGRPEATRRHWRALAVEPKVLLLDDDRSRPSTSSSASTCARSFAPSSSASASPSSTSPMTRARPSMSDRIAVMSDGVIEQWQMASRSTTCRRRPSSRPSWVRTMPSRER